jgi:hypothetical protein
MQIRVPVMMIIGNMYWVYRSCVPENYTGSATNGYRRVHASQTCRMVPCHGSWAWLPTVVSACRRELPTIVVKY